tara:strand:+ start:967 stop:1191 length:225 start_codon:yes stop_codon:yes gene_type:complete
MIKDYIFANKKRFKVIEADENYIIEMYSHNELIDEFRIEKGANPREIRESILFWFSMNYSLPQSLNTIKSKAKS